MSLPSRAKLTRITLALIAFATLLATAAAAAATDVPRYAQRRVYGMKPGPRLVIVALPGVSWADLRRAEAPNLHKLIANGAVGLMPVAEPGSADPTRTWVTLGAGAAAAGGPGVGPVTRRPDGGIQADIASILAANERAKTKARPGLLGERLQEVGLKTAVVEGVRSPAAGAAVVMDTQGRVDLGLVARDLGETALRQALQRCDVVVVDLGSAARGGADPLTDGYCRAAEQMAGSCLRALQGYDALIAVVSPVAPQYPDPIVHKSLGPILLYDTKRPRPGLLYTPRTRWPGLVTAADFAPTVLEWWQIEGVPMGRPMEVRPGGPEDLDRLDRMLSDHYAWGFPAVKLYMGFCFVVLALGLWFTVKRPELLPRLRGPALAIPLIPVALLVAAGLPNRTDMPVLQVAGIGVPALQSFLLISLALTVAVVCAATRWRRPEVALAVPMLLGALVIVGDTLTGAWLTRTAPYAFPVMSGSRFHGLGNEYMGVLLGLSVIGLAAGVQAFPRAERFFAPAAALVVLVVGAPFWGANWGGAVSVAAGLAMVWLFLKAREAWWAVPVAVGAVLLSALLPAALDLVVAPNAAQRTHIGATFSALLSGQGSSLGAVIERKLEMSWRILRYTPWTLLLIAAVGGVFWVMLRAGAPARRAVEGRRPLAAGLTGALSGGVVAMVVNDSGVVAGAGALAAAMAAVLVLAATPREPAA